MKLAKFSCLALMLMSSVAMADVRLDLNGGQRSLGECGGSIEATAGGTSDQVNLVLRGVKSCSNFGIGTTIAAASRT